MSLLKKGDVKSHLSTHDRNGKSLYRPSNEPDATGFSGEEAEQVEGQPAGQESPRQDGSLDQAAGPKVREVREPFLVHAASTGDEA